MGWGKEVTGRVNGWISPWPVQVWITCFRKMKMRILMIICANSSSCGRVFSAYYSYRLLVLVCKILEFTNLSATALSPSVRFIILWQWGCTTANIKLWHSESHIRLDLGHEMINLHLNPKQEAAQIQPVRRFLILMSPAPSWLRRNLKLLMFELIVARLSFKKRSVGVGTK